LTWKNQQFQWIATVDKAFKELQSRFTRVLVLMHPKFEKPFIVEIDASNYATRAILSQHCNNGYLSLGAYRSFKMQPIEQNYDIYDKELLSRVLTFQEWRVYLEDSLHHIHVIDLRPQKSKKFHDNHTPQSTTRTVVRETIDI